MDRKRITTHLVNNILSLCAPASSPALIAAKNGITEIVQRILENFPVAILDQDQDEKNIVLLAVEYRQVHVYNFMLGVKTIWRQLVFGKVDREGNSAAHLVAFSSRHRPCSIFGKALQMQWEIKWYKYVLNSMEKKIFPTFNDKGKTSHEIFNESHNQVVKDGKTWLAGIAKPCSAVATLIITVTLSSSSQVPGGLNQNTGFPVLGAEPAFNVFAIASVVALCTSIFALIMFLGLLTSRYEVRDFERALPVKLILGLASLSISVLAMLVAFCSGNFFVVGQKFKSVVYPMYALMFYPVAVSIAIITLDFIKATLYVVPEPTEYMQDF